MLDKFVEKKISNFIIGVDEVGRGPLAGPVVSAAVKILILMISMTLKNYQSQKGN